MVVEQEEIHSSLSPLAISIKRRIENIVSQIDLKQIHKQVEEMKSNQEQLDVSNPELFRVQKVFLQENGLFEGDIKNTLCIKCSHAGNRHLDDDGICLVAKGEVCICDQLIEKWPTDITSKQSKLPKKEIVVEIEQDSRVNSYIHSLTKL
jgi:hypothetical protein